MLFKADISLFLFYLGNLLIDLNGIFKVFCCYYISVNFSFTSVNIYFIKLGAPVDVYAPRMHKYFQLLYPLAGIIM